MATYTHGHHESVLRSHNWRTAENSASYLLPHLRPEMTLLDVGCGPGTITADLATMVSHVTGVDSAAEVIELARQQAPANAMFQVADVHRLAFADASFDVVHAHQVLQHVADPVRALGEMRRVCRPGGIVAVRDSDYRAFAWYPELPALDDWRQLYLKVATENGGAPDAGRRLLSWGQQAGFDDITATSSTWCFATPEDRAWWGGMWADRIRDSAIAERALSTGYATRDQLDQMAAAWQAWAQAPDGWLSILHGELICRPLHPSGSIARLTRSSRVNHAIDRGG
jgi:SAM-dependent methyltransferase